MKKMRWMALVGVLFLASCGGGGGESPGEAAAEASVDAFLSIMMSDNLADCVDCVVGTSPTCNCPGGGNITLDATCSNITVNNCKSSDGKNFNGTITTDGDVLNVNLTSFGECSNMEGSNIPLFGDCSGTVSGSCAGETITCDVVDDPDDPDDCDLEC